MMKEGGAEALSVETMLRQLWARLWPDAEWEGVRGAKWSELGFQRGRRGSDFGYGHHAEVFTLKPCWNRQTQWIASECDFDG